MIFFQDKTKGQIIILIKQGFVFANSLFSCVGLLLINVSEFLIKPAIYTRVAWLRARVCVETTGKAYTVSKLIMFGVHGFCRQQI